jgi:hypothetical protein
MKKFQDFIQEACGLWDKFLALWSSRNNSCWGAPDLVAPLFKTQFISQVQFASLPCELCPLTQLQLLVGPSI